MPSARLALPLVLALSSLATGCREEPSAPSPPDPSRARVDAAALERASAAARELGQTLKGRLMGAMAEGGPAAAVDLCATQARELTAAVGQRAEARVGRSSLRLRNPANAAPPWVAAWLEAQGERPAEGVEGIRQVVDTEDGRSARVLVPIAVEAPCLVCHGDPAAIPAEVKTVLQARYPEDRATGYRLGDLRGALFAELRIP